MLFVSNRGSSKGSKLVRKYLVVVVTLLTFCSNIQPSSADSNPLEISILQDEIVIHPADSSGTDCSAITCSTGAILRDYPSHSLEIGEISKSGTQILINIESAAAPRTFEFEISGATGIESIGDGSFYRLHGGNGDTISWLSAPWARDSSGISVPTHFEFSNGRLIQFVEFVPSQHKFPIQADPYLWIDLISYVVVDSLKSTKNLKVAVTPWLGTLYVSALPFSLPYAPGVVIAQNFGWQEVLDKVQAKYGSSMKSYFQARPTFKDQWDCHAAGAPLIFLGTITGTDKSPTWDLEGSRPANRNLVTWVNEMCNW